MEETVLHDNIKAIQCLQADLGAKLNKALTLGLPQKDCLERTNMIITSLLRVLYNVNAEDESSVVLTSLGYRITALGMHHGACNANITYEDCDGLPQVYNVNCNMDCGTVNEEICSIAPPISDDVCGIVTLDPTIECSCGEVSEIENCLTDDEICKIIKLAYSTLEADCCQNC
jgi:hypothetical protein